MTPEVVALSDFLAEGLLFNGMTAGAVFVEILYGSRYLQAIPANVIPYLTEMGIGFQDEDTLQRFVELHQEFHNKTRMQCNRGHTSDEMVKMMPLEARILQSLSLGPNIRKAIADGFIAADELRWGILEMDMPSEEVKNIDARLREIQPLIKNISNYQRLKPVYDAYTKSKDKSAFKMKDEAELVIFESARNTLLAI